jgi:hypothetical protein
MKLSDQQIAWILGVVLVCGIIGSFTYTVLTTETGQAMIVSANTWQGGDLQNYFNATMVYKGQTFTWVFSCNYFHVGDKVAFAHNWFSGYWITSDPQGCHP